MSKPNKTYTPKEEAYIRKLMSHGSNRIRAEWYLNIMQTWTKKDYDNYQKVHAEMFGYDKEK